MKNFKTILIIPYFGKLKSYFPLFLQSCKFNPNINWLFLTDNEIENLPQNVIVKKMTFEELKRLIKSKLDFEFCLEEPYKLCDFKPAYGLIFEDLICDYGYWGYCDCDLVFGNLDVFLKPFTKSGYDKIFAAGHLTLYKNTTENNRRFLGTTEENAFVYNTHKTLGFDEPFFKQRNVHEIFLNSGATVCEKDYSANPAVRKEQFVLMKYDANERAFIEQPYRKTMYIWEEGHIKGLYVEDGMLKEEEYIYMHFQNRNMQMEPSQAENAWDKYYIVPNRFIPLKKIPTTVEEWMEYDLEPKNSQLKDMRKQDWRYKRKRLKEILLRKK